MSHTRVDVAANALDLAYDVIDSNSGLEATKAAVYLIRMTIRHNNFCQINLQDTIQSLALDYKSHIAIEIAMQLFPDDDFIHTYGCQVLVDICTNQSNREKLLDEEKQLILTVVKCSSRFFADNKDISSSATLIQMILGRNYEVGTYLGNFLF
jgi:hypothetical protein